ncbi:MAG: division/cell wall cluster transcriptional repressor MraZ [Chloroflexota bacterium]
MGKMSVGFLGEYEYSIDLKGRISIPPRFRELFSDGLILCRGFERCITVYSPCEWEKMTEVLVSRPLTRVKSRRLSRAFFSGAFRTELDGQGRVILPAYLREYGKIEDGAVVVGVNSYLEIWSKQLWAEEKVLSEEEAWQIAEGIELRT